MTHPNIHFTVNGFFLWLTETEICGSGAQIGKTVADEMAEQIPVSAGSSSEESDVLQKRKRKPPGQWWLSCHQNTEDTKVIDNQPTTRKSKLNKKELTTELPSPVEVKKQQHKDLKKFKQKRSAPAATEHTAAEKKTKRGVETPDKRETTDVEQTNHQDEQLDVPGQDHHEDLSPLVFAQRDINLGSGEAKDLSLYLCKIVLCFHRYFCSVNSNASVFHYYRRLMFYVIFHRGQSFSESQSCCQWKHTSICPYQKTWAAAADQRWKNRQTEKESTW